MSNASTFVYNPDQQYLFRRAYAVSIGKIGKTAALQYGTQGIDNKYLGKNSAPLRVTFDIDKCMAGTSNKSKIEIYNLSIPSRQAVTKGYVVNLQAGYNNLLETLFLGNIVTTSSKRMGPDIVTCMECGDGESSITFSRLDKSYPAGVTLAQVLSDCGKAMSVTDAVDPVGANAGIGVGIPEVIYQKGLTVHGTVRETLTKLLKPQGLEWTVQNGNLNVIPVTAYNGNTAIVVASGVVAGQGTSAFDPAKATGMIGVPSQNQQFTQFTSLLNPKLVPGALVQLVSENTALNGFYKIRRSHFEGDSHDTKWQVTCECTIQNGGIQNLPASRGFDYGTAVV